MFGVDTASRLTHCAGWLLVLMASSVGASTWTVTGSGEAAMRNSTGRNGGHCVTLRGAIQAAQNGVATHLAGPARMTAEGWNEPGFQQAFDSCVSAPREPSSLATISTQTLHHWGKYAAA
ncbi:MAG: hypothetical protein JSR65_03580 [Proteobacteria bacterium]|nr:hypothetical protein [Pseudomonadota bacterium]